MRSLYSDNRKSGISLIGDLPWGSHFCQFYQAEHELIDILAPYFNAGLENNELCLWAVSAPLSVGLARKALKKALPQLDEYESRGCLAILPYAELCTRKEKPDDVIVSILDEAISRGFDGLRFACNAVPGDGKVYTCYGSDAVSRHNVIAAYAYPRDDFDAVALMEVVKSHRFALLRNVDKWELIESSEARSIKDALRRSEEKLKSLFGNMSEGFAYHRIILDPGGKPCDYVFLEVNKSFERLTGLKAGDIIGKPATKVLPGIDKDSNDWIGRYGEVALSGEPAQFESYSRVLGKWFSVSAFSPHKGYFAVTFSDITDRKKSEEKIRHQSSVMNGVNRMLREALSCDSEEDLGRTCLAVAEELTHSQFGFIAEMRPDGSIHDIAISDPGWKQCQMPDPSDHRRLPGRFRLHGIYGRVLLDGKAVLTNNPAAHPDSIGTPPGHPELTSFLGVPLILAGKTVGMIGVGNRKGGYRKLDLEALEALSSAVAEAFARKRAEQELQRSREWLRVTLSSIGDAVIATDTSGVVTFLNPVAEALTGWQVESASGRPVEEVFQIVNEETRKPAENVVAKVLNEGIAANLANHTALITRDGREIPIEDSAAPIRDCAGNVIGVVLVFHDVAEKRRAQEALVRAKEEWERTFRSVPDLIAILDNEHRVVRANPAMAKRLGLTPEECVGLPCYRVIHGLNQPPKFCPHSRTIMDGREHATEVHEKRLGGDFLVSTTPIFGDEGRIIGSIHVARDITERKEMERDLRRSRDELELRVRERTAQLVEANQALRDEIAERKRMEKALRTSERRLRHLSARLLSAQEEERKRIALDLHDSIGSLLTSIKMALESMFGTVKGDSESAKSVQSLISMTQLTIDEARRMMAALRPSMLDDLGLVTTIHSFCRSFQEIHSQVFIESTIEVEEEHIPEDLKIVIYRIMQEALNNVAKYSHAELVELSLRKRDTTLELTIEDNGEGFDLEAVLARGVSSKGLGLASMQERTELSGGSFRIQSTPGEGTAIHARWDLAARPKAALLPIAADRGHA